jgi:hypothetical protein
MYVKKSAPEHLCFYVEVRSPNNHCCFLQKTLGNYMKKYLKVGKPHLKQITILATSLLTLSACGGSSGNEALLRVIHGSPDAPNVDVLVDDDVVLTDVAYKEGSGYIDVEQGKRRIRVNVAGTDTTVIDATVDLAEDVAYSVIASNKVSDISALVLTDDISATNNATSGIRVVHNAPSAPAVDVYVTTADADLATSTPVLSNVVFGQSSAYLDVPKGTYRFRVTVSGTKTVAIDATTTVEGDNNYSVIALDNTGGGSPFQALVQVDKE